MQGELTIEYVIEGDRMTGLGVKPVPLAPWFIAMLLHAVLAEIERNELADRLGAPRRFGVLELPPEGRH